MDNFESQNQDLQDAYDDYDTNLADHINLNQHNHHEAEGEDEENLSPSPELHNNQKDDPYYKMSPNQEIEAEGEYDFEGDQESDDPSIPSPSSVNEKDFGNLEMNDDEKEFYAQLVKSQNQHLHDYEQNSAEDEYEGNSSPEHEILNEYQRMVYEELKNKLKAENIDPESLHIDPQELVMKMDQDLEYVDDYNVYDEIGEGETGKNWHLNIFDSLEQDEYFDNADDVIEAQKVKGAKRGKRNSF